ncbi:MAG: phosphoenolpyruvate carboxykinase (ATP), partial [Cytophagales bacterium]
ALPIYNVEFEKHPIFGLDVPISCPNVPSEILNPRNTWTDKDAYDNKANQLARAFVENFQKYEDFANADIMAGAPKAMV